MYSSLALAAALWPAAAAEHCPPQPSTIIIGVAYDSSHKFLYCEYFSKTDEQQINVDYVRKTTTFAHKELNFSTNLFVPAVTQIDYRNGERRESHIEDNNIRMTYQENTRKKINSTTIATKDIDIVDAGFNNFVKANWEKLIAGKPLPANFGSIIHQKSLPLLITAIPVEKCNLQKNSINIQSCFVVDINNSFLRLLLSSIKISYDSKHRLLQFDGVVNIQDDLGRSQSATINYFYKEDYLLTTDY